MDRDTSDILGQKTMPRSNGRPGAASSYSMTQAVFASIFIVAVIVVGRRLWRRILIWRERSLRLATRRRHGIPDNDHRPFNVAYNDAMTKSREDENSKKMRPRPSFRPQAPTLLQPESAQELPGLRNRTSTPQIGSPSVVTPVPGRYSAATYGPSSFSQTNHAQNTLIGEFPQTNDVAKNGLSRHGGYVNIDESDNEGKKRGFEEEYLKEHESKKSRVEGEDMIDGDEDAEFEDLAPKRGSKRGIHDEDNEPIDTKKSRGKRARKISLEKSDMDVDVDEEEADEVTELPSTTRGKKRDRAEAGSTFGGDDGDSAEEPEDNSDAIIRRRRKRRTVSKRKSEASHMRGKKRDRVGQDDLSEGFSEGESPEKLSTHKKGRRSSHGGRRERAAESDISMEDSSFTKSKVREIGDEWESNGVKYKIGPNGQRLRQALVKKARQKFVMPKDSQHPDRDVNLQVCIETWLTEEEYQEAKAQHNLAWQDEPSTKNVQKLSIDISPETTPIHREGSLTGKNLLWSSTSTPTGSPIPQTPPPEAPRPRAYRHSLGTASLAINPFTESQIPTVKRIASTARSIGSPGIHGSSGLSDSTNGSPRKVLSKWEKQEHEARAMMKIREANKKKEQEEEARRQAAERERAEQLAKERLEKERVEKEKAEKERAELEKKNREAAANSSKAPTSMPPPPNPTASNSTGAAPIPTPSAGASSFFSVPTSGTAPASLFSAPSKSPTATSGQPSSTNGFSFANPAQPSLTSSATPAPAPAQPPAAPTGFSFANPSTSSSTSAPFAPSATSAPSGTPSSTPSGFSFGVPKKEGEAATNAASSGGPSLMSRLGPQVSETPKTSTQSAPAPNAFSFAKPTSSSTTGTTSSNPFGQPASSAPANGASTSTAQSNGGSGLKFSFGVPNKTTTPAPSTGSAAPNSTSSLNGALGSDPQKTAGATAGPTPGSAPGAASLFSFKTPTTPASAINTGTASTTPAINPPSSSTTAPSGGLKFNFGTSAFGTQGSTANKDKDKEPPKSGFGAPSTFGTTASNTSSPFGNTTNASSAFGANGASTAFGSNNNTPSAFGGAKPSAFGNTNTTSAFGNTNTTSAFGSNAGTGPSPFGATAAQTSSAFGGSSNADATTKPADSSNAPKPLFSFAGTTSTTPASSSTPASTTTANKPSFSFGPTTQTTQTPATPATGAASTTPASTPASGGFSFNFGAKPSTATTTTPSQPPPLFGASSTPGQSAFGNLSNTAGSSNVFGGAAFGAPAQSK